MKGWVIVLGLLVPAVAYAESGWLLMGPPRTHEAPLGIPLVQWEQYEAFDSAGACEQRRRAVLAHRMNATSMQIADVERAQEITERAYHELSPVVRRVAVWLASRCLPASAVPIK